MKGFCKFGVIFTIAMAVLAFGMSSPANAAFKLRITDVDLFASSGGTLGQVTITGAGGVVTTAGPITVGQFTVSADGFSKPLIGNTDTLAHMHLHALGITNLGTTTDTLRFELTDTGFVLTPYGPGAGMTSMIGGTATPVPQSQLTLATQTVDLNNNEFTSTSPPGAITLTNAPPPLTGAFSDTKIGNFAYAGQAFSITERDELVLPVAGAISSFDADSQVVTPAPGGLILAASGALTLLGGYRLRRKKMVA